MLLCKKIKLQVSEADAVALEFMQGKCRGLYNWWVMRLRNGERWNVKVAKQSLRESKQYDRAPLRRAHACCGSATPLVSKWLKGHLTFRRKVRGGMSMVRARPNG